MRGPVDGDAARLEREARVAGHVVVVIRVPERVADLGDREVGIRRGGYDDPDTPRHAFEGADRLLLISSPELDNARRFRRHAAVLEAAGVGAVVHTSFPDAGTRAYDFTGAVWTFPVPAGDLGRICGTSVTARVRTGRAPGAQGLLDDLIRAGGPERRTDGLRRVPRQPPASLAETVTGILTAL